MLVYVIGTLRFYTVGAYTGLIGPLVRLVGEGQIIKVFHLRIFIQKTVVIKVMDLQFVVLLGSFLCLLVVILRRGIQRIEKPPPLLSPPSGRKNVG